MRPFKTWILLSTISTYFLIFVGGLVRAAGAGLGCPDWPKCFGHWFPPSDVSQLPAHIDPSLYNYTLAWIEYGNRMIGAVTGLFIAVAAFIAIFRLRHKPRVLYAACSAALLVAFQGWQGSRVVASQLQPHTVSLHMLIAFVIISLLVYAAYQVHFPEPENRSDNVMRKILILVWLVAMIQIVLGTEVRATLDSMRRAMPFLSGSDLMAETNYAGHVHTFLGFTLSAILAFAGFRILRTSPRPRTLNILRVLAALVGVQLLSGFFLVFFGRPELIQIVHLWVASLLIGSLVILQCEFRSAA